VFKSEQPDAVRSGYRRTDEFFRTGAWQRAVNSRLDRFQSHQAGPFIASVALVIGPAAPAVSDLSGHSPREARQPGRILLVEDSKVNQMVARQLLERRGHTVVVANNGREALVILDAAASAGFGCVLMDVQMPEMGGLECTAAIRDRERGTALHLPIIALTAHELEAACLAAGMDAYLSKPVQRDALFELVERYLAVSSLPVSRP
jgi:CheY-like chemotaxis protein